MSNALTYFLLCVYVAVGATEEMRQVGDQITELFQQVIDTLQSQPWNALS
jgi:hypothetical protein